jgi:3-phenylpropionate/trans-cinnamate dioxygenase ferredoxin reductase component
LPPDVAPFDPAEDGEPPATPADHGAAFPTAISVPTDARSSLSGSDWGMGVVVVGNGVSGFACAARLAERGVAVTMIGPGLPHDRPPLSKRALLTGRLPLLADVAQLAERGIEHIDGVVTACDLQHHILIVRPSTGDAPFEIAAPTLVWATGLRYPKPPVAGFEQAEENATGAGLVRLVGRLAVPHRRVVVVGAGLIGTETAATLAGAHEVTLLDMLDRPLARLLPRVSDAADAALDRLGVRFLGSCKIDSVRYDADGAVVQTSTHGDLRFDVVVSAAGFRSSLPPELTDPDASSLTLPADERLRVVGHEGLWACGDCVSFPHPRWGRIGIPHWDHALWSGRHAAESILGSSTPYEREPYFFSDIGRLRIQQVGLADAAVDWHEDDGLVVGRDADGTPACALLLNAPARLREARELVAVGSRYPTTTHN